MITEETLREIVDRITAAVHPQAIILFGSHARGEAGQDSDLDLMVVAESNKPRIERYGEVRRLFRGMGLGMDILVYTPGEFAQFQSVPGSLTHTILHEGRVLYGRT
jgi:predicted nucleotidyltransferase